MASGDVVLTMTSAGIRLQSSGPQSGTKNPQTTELAVSSGATLLTATIVQLVPDTGLDVVAYVFQPGKTYDISITEH